MFGIPSSFKIIERINSFLQKDKTNKRKYKAIIAPPFTLLQDFSKKCKNKKIIISAQNCYHKDLFGAHTGSISPFMIKKMGVKYIIIGLSENRASGETNKEIEEKFSFLLKINLISFFVLVRATRKKNKKTLSVLKNK